MKQYTVFIDKTCYTISYSWPNLKAMQIKKGFLRLIIILHNFVVVCSLTRKPGQGKPTNSRYFKNHLNTSKFWAQVLLPREDSKRLQEKTRKVNVPVFLGDFNNTSSTWFLTLQLCSQPNGPKFRKYNASRAACIVVKYKTGRSVTKNLFIYIILQFAIIILNKRVF